MKTADGFKIPEGAQAWVKIERMPELAILTKGAIYSHKIAVLHHARNSDNVIYSETQYQFIITGLDNAAVAVSINGKTVESNRESEISRDAGVTRL